MFRCFLLILAVVATLVVADMPAFPEALFQKNHLTGVASMRHGDVNTFMAYKSYGMMNYEHSVPMTLDAQFPIASNTKLHTAIALWQLQERGVVNLDDDIANHLGQADFAKMGYPQMTKYCPTLPNSTTCQKITFKMLLDMSSGIPTDMMPQFEPYLGSIAAVYGQYFLNLPLLFVPGTNYYYSNSAYILAGYFIEKLSGLDLVTYYQKNIYGPVGMKHTFYDPSNEKFGVVPNRPLEYYQYFDTNSDQLLGTGRCSSEADLGSANAAGGAISTMDDEALLYFTLFNFSTGGKPVFQKDGTLLEFVQPRVRCPQPPGFNLSFPVFFAQGLNVVPSTNGAPKPTGNQQPDMVFYLGELMCTTTTNLLDLRQQWMMQTPVLTQVFSSTGVMFPTSAEFQAATVTKDGFFWDVTGAWRTAKSVLEMAFIWHTSLFPPN